MRVVKAFTSISEGHAALEQFSMIMNMDFMSKHVFHKCSQQVLKRGKMSGNECLSVARTRVRQHCLTENSYLNDIA
jgi:hypothetical protein